MMKVLNQTWKKTKEGIMVLIDEERIQIPDPEPTLEERVKRLEDKLEELELAS